MPKITLSLLITIIMNIIIIVLSIIIIVISNVNTVITIVFVITLFSKSLDYYSNLHDKYNWDLYRNNSSCYDITNNHDKH